MFLKPGDQAPEFSARVLREGKLSLHDLTDSDLVLLKFYRFATCPICNLHLREVIRRHDELERAGLTTVVLFHSPIGQLEKAIEDQLPFKVVADPGKKIFREYAVEASWAGMASLQVMRDYARAMANGFFSKPFGHEGGITGLPADFLVDREGVVRFAHYGKNYADTLRVDQLLEAAGGLGESVQSPAVEMC